MKLASTLLFTFFFTVLNAQQDAFDLDKFEFRGLAFHLEKEQVLAALGPSEVHYPEYECGFHSMDQPGAPFYQLVYSNCTYIGSDKEIFQLERVNFDEQGKTILKYGPSELSGQTTREGFSVIFGDYAREQFKKHPEEDGIILLVPDNDDGALFTFKDGKLSKFEYWSPC